MNNSKSCRSTTGTAAPVRLYPAEASRQLRTERSDFMLTYKQLQDATKCEQKAMCHTCAMANGQGTADCTMRTAQTALAYREMLERLEWNGSYYRCPMCGRGDKHKPDCELAALLKESEVEHDA
jgi:hypothetical protein